MKVLVTGATGFVGSALVRHLLKQNYEVRVLVRRKKYQYLIHGLNVEIVDGDVTHPEKVEQAVKGCDVVFDVASVYRFYPFWEKEARALYKVNVQGTVNLLNAAMKHGVKRFVHTSSIAAIGKRADGKPSDENTPFKFEGSSHYAKSKYMAEQEVLKFCAKGLNGVILNPGIVIGARDYKPTPSGDVIVKYLNRSYPGYFDTLWAIADVDDVARAHINAITMGQKGERYILCNKEHYTLKGLFDICEKISGIPAPRLKIPFPLLLAFVYVEEALSHFVLKKRPLLPTEGVHFCKMSIRFKNSKAEKDLKYQSTPVEETLSKAIDWYQKNAYVRPGGFFRVRPSGGLRSVKWFMKVTGMHTYTDHLTLGSLTYFVIGESLRLLEKLGLKAREDGWRKVTRCYLRTEHSKFGLTALGVDFWSDSKKPARCGAVSAGDHLAKRLYSFLKNEEGSYQKVRWKAYSATPEKNPFIDITVTSFKESGEMSALKPFLDPEVTDDRIQKVTKKQKDELLAMIRDSYNATRHAPDKVRPLILNNRIRNCVRTVFEGNAKEAYAFVDRILASTFVRPETMADSVQPNSPERFHCPSFIQSKHPGMGMMNIVCRFSSDYSYADLWFQFHHAPIDGVPAQEMLSRLKKEWGKAHDLKLPAETERIDPEPQLCSTYDGENAVYMISRIVDFRPFLLHRKELNKKFAPHSRRAITAGALLMWKLAQYREFNDVKFTLPVDIEAKGDKARTLGFVMIRPGAFFDPVRPDRGFYKFQMEFHHQLSAVRRRNSHSYKLLNRLALAAPILYSVTEKSIHKGMQECVGSVGMTIIKKSEYFMAPYSDVHTDGFIALSDFSTSVAGGGKACIISIKGPRNRIEKYMNILDEILHRGVGNDELYF